MPVPFLLGVVALGLLAVSCHGEEEPSPRPSDPPPAEPDPCKGDRHSLLFGPEKVSLCHEETVKDGIFQPSTDRLSLRHGKSDVSYQDVGEWRKIQEKFALPEMSGLRFKLWEESRDKIFTSPDRWSLEAEKLFSNGVDFCRERGVDLKEAARLASRIQAPAGSQLSPKEAAYAFMVAAVLLSLHGDGGFYESHRDFVDGALQKIDQGRLKLKDLSREGKKGDFFNRALYSIADNTLQVSEVSLDLRAIKDRSTLIHELFHFFQDSERRKVSLVEGEVQAYMTEAEYMLGERKLLEKDSTAEDLERFIATEINAPKAGSHHPVPAALRAAFFQTHGDKKGHETWLNKCRDDAEVTKTLGGFFEIMTGPVGPGRPNSVTSRFMRENAARLQEPGAEKIWDQEIQRLTQAKKNEIQRLKTLLADSKVEGEPLLRQYFQTLRASLDLMLMERLRVMRGGRSRGFSSSESSKDPSQDNFLVGAAEQIARLRVNRRLFMPMDGIEGP